MKHFKLYNILIAIFMLPLIFILPLVTMFMEPYYGDLTRLGGFREYDFGWHKERIKYEPSLFEVHTEIDNEYQTYSDVVVFGDSFSRDKHYSWPNHFVNETGLSVSVFHVARYPVEKFFKSPKFKNNPPQIVIYESGERALAKRLDKESKTCEVEPDIKFMLGELKPRGITPETTIHSRQSGFLDYGLAIDYVKKALRRILFGINKSRVLKFKLNRKGLFSSRNDEELLIIKRDVKNKRRWKIDTPLNIKCKLVEYQNLVQSNGQTLFIATVVPDKLTAYESFIDAEEITGLSKLDEIADIDGLNFVRIDKALIKAIHEGVVDVYLPNDTHWGSAGHKIVTEELIHFIKRKSYK